MGTAFDPTEFVPGQTPYSSSEMNKLGQGIAGAMPVGAIISSFVLQPGFVALDGSLLSRTTYDALFAWADANDLVGAGKPFGPGDGATTFQAPDFTGRMLRGATAAHPAGTTGGSETHGHTNPTSGAAGGHDHSQTSTGQAGSHAHSNPSTGSAGSHAHSQGNTGSGGSHSHGSAGSHSHSTGGPSASTLVDTLGPDVGVASSSHTHSTGTDGSHSHGSAGSHAHSNPNTNSGGDHSHAQGNTGAGGTHGHSNPNVDSVSNHQHTVGATDDADHLPPWGAVVWQIRY